MSDIEEFDLPPEKAPGEEAGDMSGSPATANKYFLSESNGNTSQLLSPRQDVKLKSAQKKKKTPREKKPSFSFDASSVHSDARNADKDIGHCLQCPYSIADSDKLTAFQRFRMDLHLTLEDPSFSTLARIISIAIMLLIFVSTLALMLETVQRFDGHWIWDIAESSVSIIFTAEYVLRLLTCRDMAGFILRPLNLVDLVAILPFYWGLFTAGGGGATLRVFRVVRLARVFRLFKISRYSSYMKILATTMSRSKDAFGLLFFFLVLAIIVFSSLMYYAERGVYDETRNDYFRSNGKPSPFTSIPASFYWCIVTMTTVGYGDVVPVEPLGKVVCCAAMICGILVFALPVTILGSNFQAIYDVERRKAALRKVATTKNTKPTQVELLRLLTKLRSHRDDLHATLASIRVLVQRAEDDPAGQAIWESIDNVVMFALENVEHAIEASAIGHGTST